MLRYKQININKKNTLNRRIYISIAYMKVRTLKKKLLLTVIMTITVLGFAMGNSTPIGATTPRLKIADFKPYKFIAFGDTRNTPEGDNAGLEACAGLIENLMGTHQISFILHCGDMVDSGADQSEYDDYYWPEMQSIAGQVPIYYAAGNHEYESATGTGADIDLVTFKANVENPGNEVYYSFNSPQNDTHFIVLNTDFLDLADAHDKNATRRAEQMAWLQADFAANDIDRIVVMMHRPAWGVNNARTLSDYRPIRAIFHDLFVANGVDFVFQGHDHHFYHTVRNDTDYMIMGAGTAALTLPNPNGNWVKEELLGTDFYFGDTYGVCLIEATEAGFDVDVIVANGSTVYEFSIAAPAADIYLPTITSPNDVTMTEGTTGNNVSWTVTDANPGTYSIDQDGTEVATGSWQSGVAIVYSLDSLTEGDYVLAISAEDENGNSVTDSVSVKVIAATSAAGPGFELIVTFFSILGISLILIHRKRSRFP